MKLLEVVAATQSSIETLSTAQSLAKRIDKIACVVGLCFGFVGNRMFSNYTSESNLLLLEGAEPEQIDAAMTDWGMAMGPLAVEDHSGLDVGYRARQMRPDSPRDERYFRPANLLVEQGRLGQKTAAGFYRYRQQQRENDGVVMDLIGREANRLGFSQRRHDPEEIQQRLIYTLINEGARLLDQGITQRASDIDVIWINGYGFPRWRGGPMYYADRCGLQAVVDALKRYYPSPIFDYQQPAPTLVRMAQAGEEFGD
jgi:3-hydroxyacyl-CoA dehydrogenase